MRTFFPEVDFVDWQVDHVYLSQSVN